MEILTKDENDFIENFWLGVTHTKKEFKNVFKTKQFRENPAYSLVSYMAEPDNFAFTCKHLFNLEILPVQLTILKELWYRPFPMFIASRGFGKCITGDSFIQTNDSFCRIGDLIGYDSEVEERKYFNNEQVLNEKGFYNDIEYGWNNGYTPTIKITTKQGFELEGTLDHPIRVTNNGKIEWKELKDLSIGTYIPISRNENWINNTNNLPEDLAYWFGLVIGDGGYTIRGRISFTSKDEQLHKAFREIAYKYFNKEIRNSSEEITKSIYSTEVWDELFSKYGFNSPVCGLKDIPKSVLSASKKSVAAFLRGLMDTDGCFTKVGIEYCSKSEKLTKAVQFLLLKFGVVSRVKRRLNKKYNTSYYYLYIFGKDLQVFNKNIGFGLKRKQDRLDLYKRTVNTNKDIIPNSLVHCLEKNKKNYTYYSLPEKYKSEPWYEENYFFDEVISIEKKFNQTFDVHCKDDHSFISNGIISHNTWTLAVYSLLRILFTPGAKVVITGAAFRQSKYVFEYMQAIYDSSPVLRDILSYNRNNGPKRDIDRCIFRAGPSKCTALPIGDGKRIRGERACVGKNTIIETDKGLIRIKDFDKYIKTDTKLLMDDNSYLNPDYFIVTKPIDVYKVKTLGGYSFECSDTHQVMTTNGWRLAKDLTSKDELIFENNYKFPSEKVVIDNVVLDEDLAWLLGIFLSEGNVNKKSCISVKMTDKNCIDKIDDKIRLLNEKYSFNLNPCRYTQEQNEDKRGWTNKACFEIKISNIKFRDLLQKFGLERVKAKDKDIPWSILQSPKNVVLSFLSSMFEGDGSAFLYKDKKRDNNLGIAYYSLSENLIDSTQVLLSKLNLFVTKGSRYNKLSVNKQYHLRLYGRNSIDLFKQLNIPKWEIFYNKYHEGLFINKRKSLQVKSVEKLDKKECLYDFCVQDKHLFKGNCFIQHNSHLIAEEFASINPEVYEQVISGFAAVSATPVLNVKNLGKIEALKALGKEHLIPLVKDRLKISTNQSVICGTPDFEFGHFCKYWKRYRKIILSKGDPKKLAEIMGDITDVGSLDYTDYSVIRLPWYLAPKGLMEEKTIVRAKSTMHKSLFDMEYNAIFIGDTEGFYRRTLLEKCIARIDNQIKKSNSLVNFTVSSKATKRAKYIMGVDPASERDNFSIVILELWPDHRRIVYCWTTTRARFKAQVKKGRTNEHDFYRHCARKILDLTKLFNIEYVGMDAQGGGIAIEEALGDPTILKDGEKAIYQIIDDDKEKYTDNLDGRHILVMCQFADASWVSDANHGMKKDFEERALLFPDNDSSIMGLLLEDDKANYKEDEDDDFYDFSDKLEDIALEVDDLLYELTTIQHSKTNAGRERWDTPEIKDDSVKKKGRLVKDRYSALLIANKVARDYVKSLTIPKHKDSSAVGGFAHQVAKTKKKDKNLYYGPSWFTDQVNKGGAYGKSVKKGY